MTSIKDLIQEDIRKHDCILTLFRPVQMIDELTFSAKQNSKPLFRIKQTVDIRLFVDEDTHEFIFDDPVYASSVVEAIVKNQHKNDRFFVKSDLDESIEYVRYDYAVGSVVKNIEIIPLVSLDKLRDELVKLDIYAIPITQLHDIYEYFCSRCHLKSFERQISKFYAKAERTYSFFGDGLVLSF